MDADIEAAGLPAPGQGTRCLTDSRLAWLRKQHVSRHMEPCVLATAKSTTEIDRSDMLIYI